MKFCFLLLILLSSAVKAQSTPAYYDELLPKYGLLKKDQAFCLSDDKSILFADNLTKTMKPASVSKLYVTDWALEKVGSLYRFETKFSLKGKTLYIKGGDDPFFVTESVMAIVQFLNKKGVTELDQIIFDAHFYLNWSDDSTVIANLLKEYFNKSSSTAKSEMKKIKLRLLSLNTEEESKVKDVLFQKEISASTFEEGEQFSLQSSPLYKHMKQMNIFSNNFYAQKLFDHLGGIAPFHQYMKDEYGADEKEIHFYTGSGLGENYTTCELTMRMLAHLERGVDNEKLELKDVVSVAGTDQGTLRNRFTQAPYNKAVLAKTGTLNFITTLAGFLYTETGVKYFAVLNRTDDLDKGRSFENDLIQTALKQNFKTRPVSYQPVEYSPIEDIILK